MAKAYAGIGSRETPADILRLMKVTAAWLADAGWVLRSGCAPGADSAFEAGVGESISACKTPMRVLAELYLPWPSFEGRLPDKTGWVKRDKPQAEAFPIAERFHPAWDRLRQGGRALQARNVHQILGPDVTRPDPVAFVLCWTRDAAGGGGTGQAIRIAKHYGVAVLDLADAQVRARVEAWVSERSES